MSIEYDYCNILTITFLLIAYDEPMNGGLLKEKLCLESSMKMLSSNVFNISKVIHNL